MNRKIVALIDCQNDFIDGALGIGYDKWAKAYDYIEKTLLDGVTELICTKDYHPHNHCSFKDFGGVWPAHCVAESRGSDLYWKLNEFIEMNGKYVCSDILKGRNPDIEEYGVDVLKDYNSQFLEGIKEVNIAGLCTDYCVKESAIMTARAHPDIKIIVHLSGSAYIAEGTKNIAIKQMKEISNISIIE